VKSILNASTKVTSNHLMPKRWGSWHGIFTGAGFVIPLAGLVAGPLLIAAVWDLCRFLKGGKLVCLEKNVCVIGKVMELIPVGADKSGLKKMDDDFTFNILLSPHAEEETRNEIIMSDPFQGKFIDEQPPTTNLGLNFTQERTYENLFHCEIKGCRVHDVCIALKIMAVAGAGVTTFCALAGAAGLIGWVACLIAIIAWAILTAAVAGITWAATHTGSMDDVLDPASGTISVGDIVLVKGDWVHDAGHDPEGVGWNEIHPVRFVQKLSIPDQFQRRRQSRRSPGQSIQRRNP
jgi:hypothetical protein